MKELVWEITESCLNSCIHCSSCLSSEATLPKVVSLSDARLVGEQFRLAGFKRLILSGGEPALHPQFAEIVNAFHSLGFEIFMYTSGVYPEGFLARELETFKKITKVLLSFFSHKESVHDAIVGNRGAFSQTVNSIKCFIDAGTCVEANIVPMKLNQEDLISTSDLLNSLGVERINFLKLVKQGNADRNWDLIGPNSGALAKSFNALRSVGTVRIGNPFGTAKSEGQACGAGYQKVCISFDGYIIPCEVFKNDRTKFPNIFKRDFCLIDTLKMFNSLEDVVTGSKKGCYCNEIRNFFGMSEVAA